MTVKRRNHGRNRYGRNHTRLVNCDACGCKPPKDKSIKRFTVRNMVDKSSLRDLTDACSIPNYELPKFYVKVHYCVSCAVHRKIVRPRNAVTRKERTTGRPSLLDRYRPTGGQEGGQGGGGGAPGAGGQGGQK